MLTPKSILTNLTVSIIRVPFLFVSMSLCFVLLFTVPSIAQERSLLRVIIISTDDGNPLAGASVLLYGTDKQLDDKQPLYYGVTNRDGFTEIRSIINTENYQVRISSLGFKEYESTISFTPGEIKFLKVELEPEIEEFNEVLVEGQRISTIGIVGLTAISSIDIGQVPSPGVDGDLVSFLQTEPGVVTSGDRGGDLYIRGGTPDQNQILVDDLRIIKPFHISNLFSAFPGNVIQNVDFYAGGFGAKYSGSTSSVIDIALKPGNMRNVAFSASFSPYLLAFDIEGPIKYDSQSIYFSARTSTIESFAPHIIGEDVPLNFSDILARYSIQSSSATCNITGIYTNDSGNISPDRNIDHSWTNTVIGARCLGFDKTFKYPVKASMGFTNFLSEEGSADVREQSSGISQIYFNVDLQQDFSGQLFDYGFGFDLRKYETELSEKFASFTTFKKNSVILDAFISTDLNIGKSFSFQPGVVSQVSSDGPASLEPRLRISFSPGENNRQQFSLAVGKYAQFLSGITDERDVGTIFTVLNPVREGEPVPTSVHGILSYQQKIGSSFTSTIEGYIKDYKNIPVSKWNPQIGLEAETALANGIAYGFDVSFDVNTKPLFISVKYGWSVVEYEAASGDLGAWIAEPIFSYHPLHDQRHKINTLFSYTFAGFTALTRWEMGTGKPFTQIFGFDMSVQLPFQSPDEDPGTARILYDQPFGERLPYYHRLDISLRKSFRVSRFIEFTSEIGAINIYNRSNLFNYDYFTLQRVDQAPFFPYASFQLRKK